MKHLDLVTKEIKLMTQAKQLIYSPLTVFTTWDRRTLSCMLYNVYVHEEKGQSK